jgi:hypothetical protein
VPGRGGKRRKSKTAAARRRAAAPRGAHAAVATGSIQGGEVPSLVSWRAVKASCVAAEVFSVQVSSFICVDAAMAWFQQGAWTTREHGARCKQ